MRRALLLLVVGCGSQTAPAPEVPDAASCGTSAPRFAGCEQHELANIDLSGDWTFTGTRESDSVTSGTMQYPVSLQTVGCTLGLQNSAVDDTNATENEYQNTSGGPGVHGLLILCGHADGTLAYQWSAHAQHGTTQTDFVDSGTLTKAP